MPSGDAHSLTAHTPGHQPTCQLLKRLTRGEGERRRRSTAAAMSDPALKVESLSVCASENRKRHHSDDYDNPALIVRRGQDFKIKLRLNRPLRKSDPLGVQIAVGAQPLQSKETLVLIPLQQTQLSGAWTATLGAPQGLEYEVLIKSPPNAAVGKYTLTVTDKGSYTYVPPDKDFYLLFNPWCKEDTVYLEEEDKRQEYVLSDTGYLYLGSFNRIDGIPWNFGQFEEGVLDCCFYLLDKIGMKQTTRKDAAKIARAMSAAVNIQDDGGVLIGNWSGEYSDGTPPSYWTGSSAILQKYYKTKRPVRYGQCWVFSGVLTTVMRCLGVPARSITNFDSAHDTEDNLTIDVFFNRAGEMLNDISTDSIWNFHVWNDVWMKRPDLPEGYNGWQAIDATPQELSEGSYQCGPAPLKAIKNGDVHLVYDTKFVLSEVNADRIFWRVDNPNSPQQNMVKLRVDTMAVGKRISTKAVGKNLREDITSQYKHPEGSPEERRSLENALKMCLKPVEEVYSMVRPPMKVDFESKEVHLGSPVTLNITFSNNTTSVKTVTFSASYQLQTYDGNTMESIGSMSSEITVQAESSAAVPVEIPADSYFKFLSKYNDELQVQVNVLGETKEGKEPLADYVVVHFTYPAIKVEMPDSVRVGEKFTCTFIFKNDTGVPMENTKLHVEGLGLFKLETFDEGNIKAGGIFASRVVCTASKLGERKIIAKITSDQISGITVERSITIT
ncbi:protein-glutamine gamma-glutamyltransferase 4-like [Erpetoichthys calabaricus]|uniref:protein-glutamine gamma-glutamyltransferase 4-like n=1 Tax=Erpetoichthys calabaricus TaxID=27687 RepID=UPI0022347A4F|nr:protein-glutamine gamma-glutamyltransferase 4-like [Erpetoichthys calabaricus]